MLGLIRVVFKGMGGPAATARTIDKLMAMAELQLAIVEDLLDYTRAQTGKGATPAATAISLISP